MCLRLCGGVASWSYSTFLVIHCGVLFIFNWNTSFLYPLQAMMELAIALSLQDQSSGTAGSGLNLQNLGLASDVQGVGAAQGQSSSSLETGTLSDTTASGKGIFLKLKLYTTITNLSIGWMLTHFLLCSLC